LNAENPLAQKLTLPCGATIANRLVKSAMSENMATKSLPNANLIRLYETWGKGGLGLVITGNVMVDSSELGEPNNLVLENESSVEKFRELTARAKAAGTAIWAQINHPGRQAPAPISRVTVAPSAIAVKIGGIAFRKPRPLEESEIIQITERFATTARLCKEAGFDGVQIHGAHGYLVSQFLSPLANVRDDKWGGSLENRMRFVVEVYRAMRKAVGKKFPIGIKINSADFQRGGFEEGDAIEVVKALESEGIDVIEISGGTYESAAMTGVKTESTRSREAYFLEFAEKVKANAQVPIMLTGGFRSSAGMREAIYSGAVDFIGLARPLAMEPDLAKRLIRDESARSDVEPVKTGIAAIDKSGMLEMGYYALQLKRISEGKEPDKNLNPLMALPLLGWSYTSGIIGKLFARK